MDSCRWCCSIAEYSEKGEKWAVKNEEQNEALTYKERLTAESKLSSANLSTSVTLRVSSFFPAENGLRQENPKKYVYPKYLDIKICLTELYY